jgi:hypothetical protein
MIFFIKSDGPTKSDGLLGSVRLYDVNHFIKSVGQVPWNIPSCKRASCCMDMVLTGDGLSGRTVE